MSKTLVIAEKPSVGRDYAKALPGSFTDRKDYLESDDYVVSWAVGHLVELAEPEDYDSKYRMWSLNRLPIIPEQFKLKPIEGRGKSQLDTLRKLIKRKDVDADHQRLRRRPRGRADLLLHLRAGRARPSRSAACGCRR